MTLTGPQVLAALDEALRDIRREEDEILRKLGRAAERIAKMRETEGELLRQFAEPRLPPEQFEALAAPIAAASLAGRDVLRQRAAELVAGADQMAEIEAELGRLTAERGRALATVDRQQATLRGLSGRIAAAIARDPDYERQKNLAARLKAIASAARAKARQAELDRDQKARTYRSDRLFSYLLQRDFGGPNYRGRGLIAALDGWVARLIGYERAARHFRLLNELPLVLAIHADRQAASAAAAEEAIDEIERTAIEAAGGAQVLTGLAEAQQRITEIDGQIAVLQDERKALTAAQRLLAEADDGAFGRTVNALTRALGSPDIQSLILAQRTARPGEDDPFIAQLDDTRLRIAEERIDMQDEGARLATLASRRRALEDIEYEFKALKFDDPRSVFRDEGLIAHELGNFLTGAISAESYWDAFRRGQAWSAGTSDWGGGIGLPRRGRQGPEGAVTREAPALGRPRPASADAGAAG
ncbi:MAG TPA: hypothetical protein VHB23_01140 [Devosiaceae bacterium]|nr:hypothetical protein [Devosiaceae bacterium]